MSPPASVRDVLGAPGRPLDAAGLAYFTPRHGRDPAASADTLQDPPAGLDLDSVRIHDDGLAHRSAAEIGARAYAFGRHIVLGRDRLTAQTLRHELAHVAQQPATPGTPQRIAPADAAAEGEAARLSSPNAAAPRERVAAGTVLLDRDPAAGALYPSTEERGRIREIVPPKPEASATSQTAGAAAVTDPDGFRTEMASRVVTKIDARLPQAEKVRDAAVQLTGQDLDALAARAEQSVTAKYGRYIQAGGTDLRTTALRSRLNFIRPPEETSPEHIAGLSQDFVATLMELQGDILERHNVAAGTGIFEEVRDAVVAERTEALKTIVLFIGGFETPEHNAFVQSRVPASYSLEPEKQTRRRGRWEVFGTTLHEMLHSVAHKDFSDAAEHLKIPDVFIEGGAEIFTQEVYGEIAEKALRDDALRLQIEGIAGPYFTPPERKSAYDPFVQSLQDITGILGGNVENLRVAFFMGRVAFLGLGGWNEAEADQRYKERFPAWELGAAIVASGDSSTGLVRVRVGRVVYGRTGDLQLNLGAGISYLSSGETAVAGTERRTGAGVDLTGRYLWPKLYLGAGVLLEGSSARGRGVSDSFGLDAIPRLEAGARLGRLRVGADVEVYVPLTGGDVGQRTYHVLAGIGVSVVL